MGLAVLIAADLVLATDDHWMTVLLGVGLWGVHMGITQGLLARMVADVTPADLRGTAYGFFNLMSGLAMLVASVLAGLLWDSLGASFTFYAGAAFLRDRRGRPGLAARCSAELSLFGSALLFLLRVSCPALFPSRETFQSAEMRHIVLGFEAHGFGERDLLVADLARDSLGYRLGAGMGGHGTPPFRVVTWNQTSPVPGLRQAICAIRGVSFFYVNLTLKMDVMR